MDRGVVAVVRDGCGWPLPRREVHFALENDGWSCTFECEVHISAPGAVRGGRRRGLWALFARRGARRGRRPARGAPSGARGGAGCPNLPQRPQSNRNARRESLIFRGFVRSRYRRGAPLWQILTRPRPGPSQEPHQHHHMPAHSLHGADPAPEAAGSGEIRLNEPFSSGESSERSPQR